MKIICIGQNYADHIAEMNSMVPKEPTVFSKPDTALLLDNRPFYLPEYSDNVQYECELVIRITKNGKYINKNLASNYYSEVGLGIDFTARDLQKKFKESGKPWLLAKGFDNSAPVSKFIPIKELKNPENIEFSLLLNNKKVQHGFSKDMIFSFEEILAYISKFITLRMGDLIFTGTPSGVGKVNRGDVIKGYIEDNLMLDFEIK
ncbi:MAG: fumarylacetoacetate hydrolase family protein [Bacteroidales bacterium]|jgi:acylpyruvate hydrolase